VLGYQCKINKARVAGDRDFQATRGRTICRPLRGLSDLWRLSSPAM